MEIGGDVRSVPQPAVNQMMPSALSKATAVAALTLTIGLASRPALAQRVTPLEATVLVRLIGHVRVLRGEDERVWRERLLDQTDVEVGVGSGFIVSPEGWVITNHHVISGERKTLVVQGQKLEVSVEATSIEIVMPPQPGQPPRRFTASVYAEDPELDLAILRMTASDVPYVGLGDSDALAAGEAATAIGYPFGGTLEVDRPMGSDAVPRPSVMTGAVSGLRADAAGDPRYLQVSTPLNPGNSGGPIADADGYAIGVAQLRVRNAAGIGFAVPINRVKQMLEKHGLESILPVTLLAPGPAIEAPAKGLSIAAPAGFHDGSPSRLRFEAVNENRTSRVIDPAGEHLALRIDRVATRLSLEELERGLLTQGVFERFEPSSRSRLVRPAASHQRRTIVGRASGSDPATGSPVTLMYTIVDLGREKIVARYLGSADIVAINRSVLQASLDRLDAAPLLTAELTRAVAPAWMAAPVSLGDGARIPVLEGWAIEPGAPWPCGGTPEPSAGLTMSPIGDFTVSLRATFHPSPSPDARAAARRCSAQPGAFGESSYSTNATAWGVTYLADGVFLPTANGVWQLEMVAPADKRRHVTGAFGQWIRALAPQ